MFAGGVIDPVGGGQRLSADGGRVASPQIVIGVRATLGDGARLMREHLRRSVSQLPRLSCSGSPSRTRTGKPFGEGF